MKKNRITIELVKGASIAVATTGFVEYILSSVGTLF